MTATATGGLKRFSLESFNESRPWRVVFGIILSVAVILGVGTIVESFSGKFTNDFVVPGELAGTGVALPPGSLLLYRNVTVGKVVKEGPGTDGNVSVTYDVYPAKADQIPKNVRAVVQPLSIFGNQGVSLVVPAGVQPSTAHLVPGDTIPADEQTTSVSLQTTTTQLFNLLNAIHPADLDTALTAFATALRGEGTALGQTLDQFSHYLGVMNPLLPTVRSDIGLLAPVSASLNQAAPDLVATLGNSVANANAITQFQGDLRGLLANGQQSVTKLTAVVDGVQTSLPNLLNASGPVLAAMSANPNELSQTLTGLQQFSSAVAASASHGPFLSVDVQLPILNNGAAVSAALGYQTNQNLATALGSVVDPAPYSAANCPQYLGETSHCGSGGSPAAAPGSSGTVTQGATAAPGSGSSANAYSSEQDAVQRIATAVGGGRAPAAPGLASLVLVPLFSSMAVGS